MVASVSHEPSVETVCRRILGLRSKSVEAGCPEAHAEIRSDVEERLRDLGL